MQPLLAAPGALDDHSLLAALTAGELVADLGTAARVPSRLNEQATHVAVADLGDRTLLAVLAGGMLRGDEPDEGHELLRGAEAAEIADLGREGECARGVDAAQAAQAANQLTPRSRSAVSRIARSSWAMRASTRSSACR